MCGLSKSQSWNHAFTTFILFSVSVPVLSEQILLAPPITSQAAKCLTKLLSYLIFSTLNAKQSVTARGSPSGIATTITVIPIIMYSIKSIKYLESHAFPSIHISPMKNPAYRTTTVKTAAKSPIRPICSATLSSFFYRGVGSLFSSSY